MELVELKIGFALFRVVALWCLWMRRTKVRPSPGFAAEVISKRRWSQSLFRNKSKSGGKYYELNEPIENPEA